MSTTFIKKKSFTSLNKNIKEYLFLSLQFIKTVLSSTKQVNEKVVFTRSTLTRPAPLMCIVTKQQPVGGGGGGVDRVTKETGRLG